jgi:hypothetical protein
MGVPENLSKGDGPPTVKTKIARCGITLETARIGPWNKFVPIVYAESGDVATASIVAATAASGSLIIHRLDFFDASIRPA